jgi:hypothetical protein
VSSGVYPGDSGSSSSSGLYSRIVLLFGLPHVCGGSVTDLNFKKQLSRNYSQTAKDTVLFLLHAVNSCMRPGSSIQLQQLDMCARI